MTKAGSTRQSLADRKGALLLEGAIYRIRVAQAKASLTAGMSAPSLVSGVIEHLVEGLLGRQGKPGAATADPLQGLIPIAIEAGTLLSRKRWLVPAMGIGLIGAALISLGNRDDGASN